jgi:hypothetical protein
MDLRQRTGTRGGDWLVIGDERARKRIKKAALHEALRPVAP